MIRVRFPYRGRCRCCGKKIFRKAGEKTKAYRKRRLCGEACEAFYYERTYQ